MFTAKAMSMMEEDAKQVYGEKYTARLKYKAEIDVRQDCLKVFDLETGEPIAIAKCDAKINDLNKNMVALKSEAEWLLHGNVNDKVFMEQFWEYKMTGPEEPLFKILKEKDQLLLGDDAKPAIKNCIDRVLSVLKTIKQCISDWDEIKTNITPGTLSARANDINVLYRRSKSKAKK